MEIHKNEQIRRKAGDMKTPAQLEAASVAGILADIQPTEHTTTPALQETASVEGILGDVQNIHHTSTTALREAASVAPEEFSRKSKWYIRPALANSYYLRRCPKPTELRRR